MSFYQRLSKLGMLFFSPAFVFKHGFNLSPMYRRTSGKITYISPDLHKIKIKLPISYKNRNFVNTIFGGSMFASVDPFPMVQLINIIGNEYVVWDKAAKIRFLRPGTSDLYAEFIYTKDEVDEIKKQVAEKNEIEISKVTQLKEQKTDLVCCEVDKRIYIADKKFFKNKGQNALMVNKKRWVRPFYVLIEIRRP